MARIPLAVWLDLNRLHCYDEGDGIGSAEPYLWTVFFKVDGDSVVLGDDLFLHGTASLITTPGSHGNLGDTDVDAGDDVNVPATIGEFQTTLRPIPIPQWLTDTGMDNIGGVCGVLAVLMEEDWVSDSGAEAGHAALNTFVQQAIDGLIATIGITHPEVTDADIAGLTSGAEGKIADAVKNAQGAWDNFASWLNSDDHIGDKVWTFSHDQLAATADIDFLQRWHNEGDWELFGHVHASPTCPAEVVIAILTVLGLIKDDQARGARQGMQEFRKRVIAGDRDLGAWWALAERNAAGIGAFLRSQPEITRRAGTGALLELVAVLEGEKALPDAFITHTTDLLKSMASTGPRRLRIDAKAALGVLPTLKGKTLRQAVGILKARSPTRKAKRLPRHRTPK